MALESRVRRIFGFVPALARTSLLIGLIGLVGCAGGPSARPVTTHPVPGPFPSGWSTDDLDARSHAPRPYRPEWIRDSMPVGAFREFAMTSDGRTARMVFFVESNDVDAGLLRQLIVDDAGTYVSTSTGASTWTELALHASFPADRTTCTEETLDTPAGRFDCLRYDVERQGATEIYYFARELPGPPVLNVRRDASGESRMELVAFADTPTEPIRLAVERARQRESDSASGDTATVPAPTGNATSKRSGGR